MAGRASMLIKEIPAPPPEDISPTEQPVEGDLPEGEPKKKKKKKLTKAEKMEKKRQREIAFKKLEMQMEFQRELEMSRKVAKKLKTDWDISLREMKLIEFKQEMMVWEQKTMSKLNEKDEKLQDLVTFLGVMEEMNLAVTAQVTGIFDYLIDICRALTEGSNILYEDAACELIYNFHISLNERRDHDKFMRLKSENIMHTTNVFFEHAFLNDHKLFVKRRNYNVNTEIEKRYCIRDGIVKKMKASHQQLVDFVQELTSSVLDPKKYENIRNLMNRQRYFMIQSERLTEIANKKKQEHSNLQRELLQSEIQNQKKINDLRLEHSYFFEIKRALQQKAKFDEALTMEKEKILGSESYKILKHFKKLAGYGELLLSTATNVRKFQTEAEKISSMEYSKLPENSSETDELRKFVLTIVDPLKIGNRDEKEIYFEMNEMRVFWRRLAIVESQNSMLKQEKIELLAENKKYTDFIRKLSHKPTPGNLTDKVSVRKVKLNTCKPERY